MRKRQGKVLNIKKTRENIPYFWGVFMRNDLPMKPYKYEMAIVNLDDVDGPGND